VWHVCMILEKTKEKTIGHVFCIAMVISICNMIEMTWKCNITMTLWVVEFYIYALGEMSVGGILLVDLKKYSITSLNKLPELTTTKIVGKKKTSERGKP